MNKHVYILLIIVVTLSFGMQAMKEINESNVGDFTRKLHNCMFRIDLPNVKRIYQLFVQSHYKGLAQNIIKEYMPHYVANADITSQDTLLQFFVDIFSNDRNSETYKELSITMRNIQTRNGFKLKMNPSNESEEQLEHIEFHVPKLVPSVTQKMSRVHYFIMGGIIGGVIATCGVLWWYYITKNKAEKNNKELI